jgi:hypothetical protein
MNPKQTVGSVIGLGDVGSDYYARWSNVPVSDFGMVNKDQWRWWLEIATGLAVVISLLVLIVEVRTNTAAIERQGRIDQLSMIVQPYLDDVDMGLVLAKIKAVDGREDNVNAFMQVYDLTEVEAATWTRSLWGYWGAIEADYLYSGSDAVEGTVRAMLAFPDVRLFWHHSRSFYTEEFAAYVDEILEDSESEE